MKFSIAPFIGRLYILCCTICATIISILIIYQCYNSKLFSDSILLKIVLPLAITTGLFSLILPTQVPHKIGIVPDTLTQKYLDETVGKKLKYRIAPNNKIEIYEIPKLIWRQKIVYIGIVFLTANQCILEDTITNAIKAQPANILKSELTFWQGIESVTSNSFQLWKPFTQWYIKYLAKLVDDSDYSSANYVFNHYIVNKIKNKEFNIFENYIFSKNKEFASNSARELDKICASMWLAAYALLTNTALTIDELNLPKYRDVCQLASLGIIDLSPQKVINGLNERLESSSYKTQLIELDDAQRTRIYNHITENCLHVDVVGVAKRKLQWMPEVPSFIVTCRQRKSFIDFNERTRLIQKQLQIAANSLDGDWTVIVIDK
ncbi:hypothetical protein NIES2101_26675 [Calothrix sp. HK-06]|nr:hypothetical protein NIES2101_26675 [Calothrix sp. HK-06]